MISRSAVPFLLLVLLLLPLPVLFLRFLIAAPLAVRTRGAPGRARSACSRPAGAVRFRSPPR